MTQCRRLLEESIAQQLQGKYDIYATGKKDEVKAERMCRSGTSPTRSDEARQGFPGDAGTADRLTRMADDILRTAQRGRIGDSLQEHALRNRF